MTSTSTTSSTTVTTGHGEHRHGPRERMVRSAMALMCTQGVSGTGLREVVAHAEAPRGSLQHYFPEGKDQLVREALALAARTAARSARPAPHGAGPVGSNEDVRPSDVLGRMVDAWRGWLTESDFTVGCPVVATVADTASHSPAIRSATAAVFDEWQGAVRTELIASGVPETRAAVLSGVVISALEGAIVMSRARRSLQPLQGVLDELAPLLDAARPAKPH